jgi:hypothetical protein
MALSIERSPCKETAEGPTAKMSRQPSSHSLQCVLASLKKKNPHPWCEQFC